MNRYLNYFLIILLTMATIVLKAQDWKTTARDYFDHVRQGIYTSFPKEMLAVKGDTSILNALRVFRNDSSLVVRAKAYELSHRITLRSPDHKVRSQGIDLLLRAYRYENPEISAITLDFMKQYNKQDFTPSAKDTLGKMVGSEGVHFDRLIKLAGFLELRELIETIRPWSQPGNRFLVRWAAVLSLSRLGDPYATSEMMRRIRKLPVNGDLVYEIFPDLVYTRHPDAIAYMVEILHSDAKNCLSADVEREISMPCGYRIMEQLAAVIKGFPLELDETGDLKTDDYPTALQRVRHWFKTNPSYTILNDSY